MSAPRRILAVSLAAALAASAPLRGARPVWKNAIERSQAMLQQALQLYPGTSVVVSVGGEVVWAGNFGYANVDRGRAVNRATQFRIFELAMPLTAAAAARLAEEGRLDLDAPIGKYLPELPETGVAVTVRALVAHLGGTRDFSPDSESFASPCGAVRDAMRSLPRNLFVRPAGLGHLLSRFGYVLLSAALESATGKSYLEVIEETVLRPAGMSSTTVDDPRAVLPLRSSFYERGWFGLLRAARPINTSCRFGGGGLVSTTQDLAQFGTALLLGEILQRDTLEAMLTSQRTRSGVETGYGLGWFVGSDARGRRYGWHGGRGVGGRSAIVLVPHARLTVVMLSNIEGERLEEHARLIASFFLESLGATGGGADIIRAEGSGKPAPPLAYRFAPAPGE